MTLNLKALIVTYISTTLTFAIILTRLILRHIRGEKLQTYDKWMGAAAIPLLVRLAVEHVILDFGTNKIPDNGGLGQREIERRVVGSKLVLVCRIASVCFLWVLKVCVLGFYGKLVVGRPVYMRVVTVCRWVVGLTFILVVLTTFWGCRPFRRYWELTPDPISHCAQASVQLLTMGICNVLTDIAFIIIPLPLIYKSKLQTKCKVELAALFSVGIFVVAITAIRIPTLYQQPDKQGVRTMWISIECFTACLVANTPILYSLTRSIHESKGSKTSGYGSELPRKSWNSDEELKSVVVEYGGFIVERRIEITQEVDFVDPGDPGVFLSGMEARAWCNTSSVHGVGRYSL